MLDLSHVQVSPTDCGVSECDHEDSITRSWPTRGLLCRGAKGELTKEEYFLKALVDMLHVYLAWIYITDEMRL